jgi:hypothetical protein
MALVTKTYTFVAGTTIVASEHNTNLDTLFNLVNGNIDNANIKASAGIVDTKLAQITTASKVHGTSITGLASVPSGAGVLPAVNVGLQTGSARNTVNYQTGAVATGTTVLPIDDTIPQNTEGDQYMTLAITPTSASNYLKIDICIILAHNSGTGIGAALFQDSTVNALAASTDYSSAAGSPTSINFTHWMTSGTTSSTTFKVRAGCGTVGTTTFNGFSGNRIFGGVASSSITITEYTA